MKFSKMIYGTAIALSLVGTSLAPTLANAQTKTNNTNQHESMNTKIDNQKKELDGTIVKLGNKYQAKLKSAAQNAKSKQDKKELSNDTKTNNFGKQLKKKANHSWSKSIKKDKLSQKQQLQILKSNTNTLKQDLNNMK